MYKLSYDNRIVIKLSDGRSFIAGSGNAEDLDYQAWLAAGNTPEAADPEPENTTLYDRKILNALALVIVDEINILRGREGLALRQASQIEDAVRAKLAVISNQ